MRTMPTHCACDTFRASSPWNFGIGVQTLEPSRLSIMKYGNVRWTVCPSRSIVQANACLSCLLHAPRLSPDNTASGIWSRSCWCIELVIKRISCHATYRDSSRFFMCFCSRVLLKASRTNMCCNNSCRFPPCFSTCDPCNCTEFSRDSNFPDVWL